MLNQCNDQVDGIRRKEQTIMALTADPCLQLNSFPLFHSDSGQLMHELSLLQPYKTSTLRDLPPTISARDIVQLVIYTTRLRFSRRYSYCLPCLGEFCG